MRGEGRGAADDHHANTALARLRRGLGQIILPVRSLQPIPCTEEAAAAAAVPLQSQSAPMMSRAKKPEPPDPEGYASTVTSWKTTDPLPQPLEISEDPPGAEQLGLSPEEVAQFREVGFVVKRGLIPKEELRPFVELWWDQPPVKDAGLRREDPSTWVSPGRAWPRQNREAASVAEGAGRQPHNLDRKSHVWRWHGIGHDEEFLKATSRHPKMLHMVECLLGGPIREPKRNRGIYTVFPRDDGTVARLGPHLDGVPGQELTAVLILEDVLPRSGGFTFWPGSPQLFYPTSEQALNWVHTEASQAVMERVKTPVQPLEFTGQPGDTIFCHGLMMHSAGIQESSRIRLAVLQDFGKVRERGPLCCRAVGRNGGVGASLGRDGIFALPTNDPMDDPADPAREVMTPWHIEGMEWTAATHRPLEDMWAEWNLGREPVRGDVVDEPSWWEKYGMTIDGPRGHGGVPAPVDGPRFGGIPLSRIATYEGNGRWRFAPRGNDWRTKSAEKV